MLHHFLGYLNLFLNLINCLWLTLDLIYLYQKSKRSVQNKGKNPESFSWVTWNKYQLWTCKRYSIPRSVVQTPGNNQTNKIRGNKASRCLKPTDLDLLLIIDSSGSHALTHTRTWTGKKVSLSNFDVHNDRKCAIEYSYSAINVQNNISLI